jgi:hypothetical protein
LTDPTVTTGMMKFLVQWTHCSFCPRGKGLGSFSEAPQAGQVVTVSGMRDFLTWGER